MQSQERWKDGTLATALVFISIQHAYSDIGSRLVKINKLWKQSPVDLFRKIDSRTLKSSKLFPWNIRIYRKSLLDSLAACNVTCPPCVKGPYAFAVGRDDIPKWTETFCAIYLSLEALLLEDRGGKKVVKRSSPPSYIDIVRVSVHLLNLHELFNSTFVPYLLGDSEVSKYFELPPSNNAGPTGSLKSNHAHG